MAATTEYYTPAAYEPRAMDSLEDIGITAGMFADLKGYETMKSLVRDVFLKHGVESIGIGLPHKHYPLASNERIVALYNGEIRPVEYAFVPHRDLASVDKAMFPAAFARDIIQTLELTGLDSLLSIVRVGRDAHEEDTMELTFGRSSIVIPTTKEEEAKILEDNNIEGFQAA
ncbi:hypothetical protein V2A60_009614 [Cordyceps javanica]